VSLSYEAVVRTYSYAPKPCVNFIIYDFFGFKSVNLQSLMQGFKIFILELQGVGVDATTSLPKPQGYCSIILLAYFD